MRFNSMAVRLLPVVAFSLGACTSNPSPQERPQPTAPVPTQPTVSVKEATIVTVPTELTTLHPAFITAWQGTDPMALKIYFTDDAVVTTTAGTFTGWNDISTKWLVPLFPTMSNYTYTPIKFTHDADDIVETGNITYVVKKEGGATENVTGTVTYKWKKGSDGTWRLTSVTIK